VLFSEVPFPEVLFFRVLSLLMGASPMRIISTRIISTRISLTRISLTRVSSRAALSLFQTSEPPVQLLLKLRKGELSVHAAERNFIAVFVGEHPAPAFLLNSKPPSVK
jgi:hypothetical protein